MKFTIAVTAIVALLPIALAAPTPVDIDDAAAFNETVTHENDLVERAPPKKSGLTIMVFEKKGCSGPTVPFYNVKYDAKHANPFRKQFQSYELSRNLLPGETINLMSGNFDNDVCARVTSHTPQLLRKGCHPMGGGTAAAGGASCFKLWRHQGFIY